MPGARVVLGLVMLAVMLLLGPAACIREPASLFRGMLEPASSLEVAKGDKAGPLQPVRLTNPAAHDEHHHAGPPSPVVRYQELPHMPRLHPKAVTHPVMPAPAHGAASTTASPTKASMRRLYQVVGLQQWKRLASPDEVNMLEQLIPKAPINKSAQQQGQGPPGQQQQVQTTPAQQVQTKQGAIAGPSQQPAPTLQTVLGSNGTRRLASA